MNGDKYKELLLDRRKSLAELDEYGQKASQPVELDQTRVGRLSRMDALQCQAIAQETLRRRDNEIARIEAALKRIEEEKAIVIAEITTVDSAAARIKRNKMFRFSMIAM